MMEVTHMHEAILGRFVTLCKKRTYDTVVGFPDR
jgi:hypothetical protein